MESSQKKQDIVELSDDSSGEDQEEEYDEFYGDEYSSTTFKKSNDSKSFQDTVVKVKMNRLLAIPFG